MVKLFPALGLVFLMGIHYGLPAQETKVSANLPSSLGSAERDAKEDAENDLALNLAPNAQLALSTPNYPVTPGDVYTLGYLAGSQAVEYIVTVDTSYRIRVSNLAVINAAGKTYNELKAQVESVVTTNYPMSGVQFVLKMPAVFKVQVKGEVKIAGEVSTWALARLSSLSGHVTPYGSIRAVSVTSSAGVTKVYDLFKAMRMGDMSQDPYLRPNDVVTFNRFERQITVSGEVERPGTYQLLEGENLRELINRYGSGFTPFAETARIEITRFVNSQDKVGNKIYLTEDAVDGNYVLENHDVVVVPGKPGSRPILFVEGAVGTSAEGNLTASNRLMIRFEPGENYGPLVRRNIDWFTAVSDTKNAYILRGEAKMPINLNPLLYDPESNSPYYLEPNDTLIIPFRQYFVTVSGAVINPGRYPYIPDRNWEYYVALAGGFREDQNSNKKVTIWNIEGQELNKSSIITPETVINAETNAFLYHFNRTAPVITTLVGLVLSFLSIQALAR
jgi:protein involved in polysaccharide export with SLBB domain